MTLGTEQHGTCYSINTLQKTLGKYRHIDIHTKQ